MSISARLAVVVAVVSAIFGGLVGMALYVIVTGTIMSSMKVELSNTSERIFEQLDDRSLALGTSRDPRITNDQEYLQIFNTSKSLLYGSSLAYHSNRGILPLSDSRGYLVLNGRGDGQRYLASLTSGVVRGRKYLVFVGTAMDQYNDTARKLLELLALGGPALVVVASLSGGLLSRRALKPVEALRFQAEGLLVARAEGRLDVPPTGDELAALAVTLNVFLDNVESLLGRQKYFVASAGHELRNPLARISADIELARLGSTDAESRRLYLERASTTLTELSSICDALLRLANLESAEIEIETAPVALGSFVLNVLRPFQATAEDLRVNIVLDIENWRVVAIDESKLAIALSNIIENAMSFSESGSSIVISSVVEGDLLNLVISDSGPGFPPSFVERALDPFTRSTSGPIRGGRSNHAGLGLSIAATIVRLHGSTIDVSNREEGGARVTMSLPLIKSDGGSAYVGRAGFKAAVEA